MSTAVAVEASTAPEPEASTPPAGGSFDDHLETARHEAQAAAQALAEAAERKRQEEEERLRTVALGAVTIAAGAAKYVSSAASRARAVAVREGPPLVLGVSLGIIVGAGAWLLMGRRRA
ncbi:MAG: hypothetical protein RLZZ299_1435 [Pseudomonadota bacterium]|jgi:hypothetical protein